MPSWHSSQWVTILATFVAVVVAISFGLAIGQEHFKLLVLMLGAIVLFAAILQNSAVGAALILLFTPLEGLTMFGGDSVVKLITILCLTVFSVQVVFNGRAIKTDRTTWLALIFVGWASLSIFWSPEPTKSFSAWVSFALQSALYFLLINFVLSKQDLKLVLWGHVLGGSVLSVVLTNTVVANNFSRAGEFAGLGINLAARFVVLNVLLTILLYQLETRRLAKGVLLIPIVLGVIGIVVSLSRGASLAAVICIAILLIMLKLKGKPVNFNQFFIWVLIGAIAFYLLNIFFLNEHGLLRLGTRFQSALSDGGSNRIEIWGIGIDMFSDSPLWGHGFHSFSLIFPYYLSHSDFTDIFSPLVIKSPHNSLFSIITELGLIGFVLFLVLLLSVFRKVWHLYRGSPTNASAFAWGMTLFVFLILTSTVDNAVDRKYLWYILSLITLIVRYLTPQNESLSVAETSSELPFITNHETTENRR